MQSPEQRGGRRRSLVTASITALLAVVGTILIVSGLLDSSGPPQASSDQVPASSESRAAPSDRPSVSAAKQTSPKRTSPEQTSPGADLGPVLPGSPPVGLHIPRIGLDSTHIVDLGLAGDGTLEVPDDPSAPGWFTPGPAPGQFGPSVIAGHVDSDEGPAVFYRLGELRPGDVITVDRQRGAPARFVVDRVSSFQKDRFPTRAVYGNTTNRAELRLITCGGAYDDELGYLANTVVFAHLTSNR